jgi:hypothetical protein
MGLLNLFRRKSEESLYLKAEQELSSILNIGILFEDNKKLLKWSVPISELAKLVEVNEKRFADRTVYNWGEHTILGGLKLELFTVYWNHRADSIDKKFNSIEFLAIGDDSAGNHLRLIGTHLENKFGPGKHVEGEPDGYFEWHINEVGISLYFMQQVANKLQFKIEKI